MGGFSAAAWKLKDQHYDDQWRISVEDHWNYSDFLENRRWKEGWISFDCLYCDPDDTLVYTGITSFAADIFKAFDPKKKTFSDLGYSSIADRYDAKFHRSLARWEGDGCIYAAVALLHDVDRFFEAPGGAIVKYNPKTGELTKECIPFPHVYIQSTVIDQERGILYGQTFTPERLFAYDLEKKKVTDLGPIGSGMSMAQGENIELDDEGTLWGNWGVTRAWQSFYGVDGIRLFRYSPDRGQIEYLNTGLPRRDGAYGFEKAEAFFNLGTGCLYASGGNGSLYKIETDSSSKSAGAAGLNGKRGGLRERGSLPHITLIGEPVSDRRSRLAGLALLSDGNAYGITGRDGQTELLKFNPHTDLFELLGPVFNDDGLTPYQVHHVVAGPDDTLYCGENDNPYRSSYLWEITGIL